MDSPRSGYLWEPQALTAAGGPYRKACSVADAVDASFRWTQHEAAAVPDAAVITVYSSSFEPDAREMQQLDPALNPMLSLEPLAVWAANPGDVVGSSVLNLHENNFAALVFVITVGTDLPKFSLSFHAKDRA